MTKRRTYFLFSLIYISCIYSHSAHTQPCRPPQNLDISRSIVAQYYENHCFHEEVRQIVNKAKKHFAQKVDPREKKLIIWDIDETILSEYWFLKEIQFGYVPKLTHEWVLRAETPAIPEMRELFYYLLDRGYHIIFITGRKHNEYEATLKNLAREHIAGFDKLIVRPRGCEELLAQNYKENARIQLTQEGYTIVGSIGDQQSDLEGKCVGYPIKMPNYVYIIR